MLEELEEQHLGYICPDEEVRYDEQAKKYGGEQTCSQQRVQEWVSDEEDHSLLPVSHVGTCLVENIPWVDRSKPLHSPMSAVKRPVVYSE